jgi:predicted transcriptional regulator
MPEEEPMSNGILLISIHPEHAVKIFDGSKKVELRRVRPKVTSGDVVLVYVSSPVQALVGTFSVEKVVEAAPRLLWNQVNTIAGISRKRFDDYYSGAANAYGIFVQEARRLPRPVQLGSLRDIVSSFNPPQSYRYITPAEAAAINSTSHQSMKWDLLQTMPASER